MLSPGSWGFPIVSGMNEMMPRSWKSRETRRLVASRLPGNAQDHMSPPPPLSPYPPPGILALNPLLSLVKHGPRSYQSHLALSHPQRVSIRGSEEVKSVT